MALVKELRGKKPVFGKSTYLSENATIIGDVVCGEECSFWFNSVTRGDVNAIRMGNRVNIQDGAVVHCTFNKTETILGNNVSVGHNAIVHGCEIKDNVLIGMHAVVMDNVVVHSNSIIAAGAVVTEGTVVEEGSIYAGVPAKCIKKVDLFVVSLPLDKNIEQ